MAPRRDWSAGRAGHRSGVPSAARGRATIVAAAALLCCAGAGAALGSTTARAATGWSVTHSPDQQSPDFRAEPNHLFAVSCFNASSCMAVGTYVGLSGNDQTLAESWNGSVWSITPSLDTGGGNPDWDDLLGVSCTSTTSCIAVGSVNPFSFNPPQTLIESWNGTAWTIVASANQGNATLDNELAAVACLSSISCVAVGHYVDAANVDQTLIENWNGTSWSLATSVNQGASHNRLTAVSCFAANNCTAVGWYNNPSNHHQTLAEHWNGTGWSISLPMNRGTAVNELAGVSCPTATACVAAGNDVATTGAQQTLLESWNGSVWSITASPNQGAGSNLLTAVSCTGSTSCAAVGAYNTSSNVSQTLVEGWNGRAWSIIPSANQDIGNNILYGVACTSSTGCTAAGRYVNVALNLYQTLVETGSPAAPTSSITVTSPATGTSWARGSTHAITWSSSGSPGTSVKILLLKSGAVVKTIAKSLPASAGTFTWKVLTTLAAATTYQVEVASTTTAVFGVSGNFSIT